MIRERLLLVLTPAVAAMTIALGLRLGAPNEVRAAIVYGSPPSAGGAGLALQIAVFREDTGVREPLEHLNLDVIARAGEHTEAWRGATNDDGVAEAIVPLSGAAPSWLMVRTGDTVLAAGEPAAGPPVEAEPPGSTWMPFVRRDGDIALEAVLLGGRASPGFPAALYVRATDRLTLAPVADVKVELESDASLVPGPSGGRTDSRGWAALVVTPVGLAVTLTLRAHSGDGRTGDWVGPLTMSPGAAGVQTRARWRPDEEPEVDIENPTAWKGAYLEVDDSRGRAWAATVPLGGPAAGVHLPRLAPGLYRAIVSAAPFGLTEAETRTTWRPFFVASSDDAALALGTDPDACSPVRDLREVSRAIAACLALSAVPPIPRWIAVDGFSAEGARDRAKRSKGVRVALGAIVVAVLLELALLLRAAAASRRRFLAETGDNDDALKVVPARWWSVVVAILVALLGFALLAAFVVRLA